MKISALQEPDTERIYYFLSWRRRVVAVCIKLLPNNETATGTDQLIHHKKKSIWSPSNQTRDRGKNEECLIYLM